jgi:uncharacterized membrane-anchored protein
MTEDLIIKDLQDQTIVASSKLLPHPLRGVVLGEVHARPFSPIKTPTRILHFSFLTDQHQAQSACASLGLFCRERGVAEPSLGAKHHRVVLSDAILRFEQHSEFATYSWELNNPYTTPFSTSATMRSHCMALLEQPGPHFVSIDLQVVFDQPSLNLEDLFDSASLAASIVDNGLASVATDFKAGSDGFIRILVQNRALTPAAAGALSQRLLEIETYRMLALLGLPETQAFAPTVKTIEDALVRVSGEMTQTSGLAADHKLLDELTGLAAQLEAGAAATAYRFGASRAYDSIVTQRLIAIGEKPFGTLPSIAQFLGRRMAPAMRTCQMLEERQLNLSRKLTRAANLLRTRVDVEIEQQNRDLLSSMNQRAQSQLRLQQTVEGLSVAAVSYYVIGLLLYIFKGAKDAGFLLIDTGIATALSVPVVVILVWFMIKRIRKSHS